MPFTELMRDQLTDESPLIGQTTHPNGYERPFFEYNGNYYIPYWFRTGAGGPNSFKMFKTATLNSRGTEQDSANRPDFAAASAWFDTYANVNNQLLHTSWQWDATRNRVVCFVGSNPNTGSSNQEYAFVAFDCATDSWVDLNSDGHHLKITMVSPEASFNVGYCPAGGIVTAAGNYIMVGHFGGFRTMGSDYTRPYRAYSTDGGVTWSASEIYGGTHEGNLRIYGWCHSAFHDGLWVWMPSQTVGNVAFGYLAADNTFTLVADPIQGSTQTGIGWPVVMPDGTALIGAHVQTAVYNAFFEDPVDPLNTVITNTTTPWSSSPPSSFGPKLTIDGVLYALDYVDGNSLQNQWQSTTESSLNPTVELVTDEAGNFIIGDWANDFAPALNSTGIDQFNSTNHPYYDAASELWYDWNRQLAGGPYDTVLVAFVIPKTPATFKRMDTRGSLLDTDLILLNYPSAILSQSFEHRQYLVRDAAGNIYAQDYSSFDVAGIQRHLNPRGWDTFHVGEQFQMDSLLPPFDPGYTISGFAAPAGKMLIGFENGTGDEMIFHVYPTGGLVEGDACFQSYNITDDVAGVQNTSMGINDGQFQGVDDFFLYQDSDGVLWIFSKQNIDSMSPGTFGIYYSTSSDNGTTWSARTRIDSTTSATDIGYMLFPSGRFVINYQDTVNETVTHYRSIDPPGNTLSAEADYAGLGYLGSREQPHEYQAWPYVISGTDYFFCVIDSSLSYFYEDASPPVRTTISNTPVDTARMCYCPDFVGSSGKVLQAQIELFGNVDIWANNGGLSNSWTKLAENYVPLPADGDYWSGLGGSTVQFWQATNSIGKAYFIFPAQYSRPPSASDLQYWWIWPDDGVITEGLPVTATGSATLVVSRISFVNLSTTATGTATFPVKALGLVKEVTPSGGASVRRDIDLTRALTTLVDANLTTQADVGGVNQISLSRTPVATPTLRRDITQALPVAATGVPLLSRRSKATLVASATATPVFAYLPSLARSFVATAGGTPALQRLITSEKLSASGEVVFPEDIRPEPVGGPGFLTSIVGFLQGGPEQRRVIRQQALLRWRIALDPRAMFEINDLLAFFRGRAGSHRLFLFKDWSDYRTVPEPLTTTSAFDITFGVGDGVTTQFQLIKQYGSGGYFYNRDIVRPKAGTVEIAVNGVQLTEGVDYAVGYASGLITFTTPPADGVAVTWGGEFYCLVRFASDTQEVNARTYQYGSWPSIDLVEVIE